MNDALAKETIRKSWQERTQIWNSHGMSGYWIRGRIGKSDPSSPVLLSPGTKRGLTQPDAVWLYLFADKYADVVCFEHCNKKQNLYDKRSRYIPSSHSLLVKLPKKWLTAKVSVKNGKKPRWKAFGTNLTAPGEDWIWPVRFLRVLYALPDGLYAEWKPNHTPTGYEFFCRHNSLRTYNSPTTQEFLKRMTAKVHFLTMK